MNKKIKDKILITISAFIGIILAIFCFPSNVKAMGIWQGNMPSSQILNYTGMFPQKSGDRIVKLDPNRFSFNINKNNWQATISPGTVYCADQGKILRFGKFDPDAHYYKKEDGENYKTWLGDKENKENPGGKLGYWLKEVKNKYGDIQDVEYDPIVIENLDPGFNQDMYTIIKQDKLADSTYENATKFIMEKIMGTLAGEQKPGKYSEDIDSVNTYGEWDKDPILGPKVAVMENEDHTSNGYKVDSTGTFSSTSNDEKEIQAAYILTALINDTYGNNKKYTDEDIQTAYWMLVDPEGEGSLKQNKLTPNGKELYNESKEYASFTKSIAGGYNASIDSSSAQVIVNRNTEEYTVGPFIAKYPNYTDISYIKSMYLTTNTGSTLIVDESHNDFEIIMAGGTNSNGMNKRYPQNGEKFFIKFSASKTNYPTSINLGAKFEYISNCSINYKRLETEGHIYQYIGHTEFDGEYAMYKGEVTIKVTVKYQEDKGGIKDTHDPDCPAAKDKTKPCKPGCQYGESYEKWEDVSDEYIVVNQKNEATGKIEPQLVKVTNENKEEISNAISYEVYQPYVKMSETYDKEIAQPLTETLDGERNYEIVERNLSNGPIDLTMSLGGIVWEDAESGKESISNGTIDSTEKKMSNVIVNLYKKDGTHIATTKTNNEGTYRFSGLNAMYQYYIKFTYNGQYYQPTTYASSNTWGQANWITNSNATDIRSERITYNAKFTSIGSSPDNYKSVAGYNETFTKQELLGYTLDVNGNYNKTREAVIDEFGNLILENSSDAITQKMIQFVKDCRMESYTGDGSGTVELYPVLSVFVIDNFQYPSILTPNVDKLYPNAYYINLGLNPRQQADLAVKKDVDHVTLEVNGQKHTYTYDTLENKENAEKQWDISVRLSDAYYNAAYTRELYKSDYAYKVSNYGEKFAEYGKSKADELEVYITYKIMVRNQAMSIRAKVDELVDYYDEDLQYINERSYIEIKRGENTGKYDVKASNKTRYSENTITQIEGYDNLYITGLDDKYLTAGQTAYVYLTFKVKKDTMNNEDWVKLDEEIQSGKPIGVGKENIAEINGYSTQYAKGTQVPNVGDVSFKPAGIVDRDSKPGNLNPADVPKDGQIKHENFEDDTDKAPNIRIILYRNDEENRIISGNVWEDIRNDTIGLTTTGDGIRDNKDKTLINGVTVQLVELMENGTEYVWREFGDNAKKEGELGGVTTIGKGTGSGTVSSETPIINAFNLVKNYDFEEKHDGTYAFKSFMPGKYVVRFIYGDTVKTVTPASLKVGGLNEKSYNGQDFKSTTYQEGITQNKTYTWREKSTWSLGQEVLGKVLTEVSTFKKDASNNETANAKVNAQNQKGYLYDITASDTKNNVSDAKDIESRRNQVVDYSDNDVTNYIAEVLASHKVDYSTMNDRNQLLNDLINNTKMTAETGLMVIEFEYDTAGTDGNKKGNTYKIQNVDLGIEERPKAQLAIDKEVKNVKLTLADGSILFDAKNTATNVLWKDHKEYSVGYKGKFMDEDKFGSIENIRKNNSNKFGLIQLTMDEELMHGATIEITYQITVSNVGEVDYKDNLFYYTGNKSANAPIVTTKANQVIDYVANNLQFNVANNSNWKVISKEDIKSQGLVNSKLDKQLEKYNTIILTESLAKDLTPELAKKDNSSVSTPLVLTQLITSENDSDDLTYRNLVEIVKTSNTVGRRMEYSVVGNQNPQEKPQELDSDIAEVVRILPPFGNAGIYIIITIVALVAITIIIIGTIFIKRKVLKTK